MSKVKPPLGVISQVSQILLEEKSTLNLQFQNLKSHFYSYTSFAIFRKNIQRFKRKMHEFTNKLF